MDTFAIQPPTTVSCMEAYAQRAWFVHGLGRVLCESVLCDLALLTVDDDSFWEALPTIQQYIAAIAAVPVLAREQPHARLHALQLY